MNDCRPVTTPCVSEKEEEESARLTTLEHKQYRQRVGQLLWLAGARVDILYATKELSRSLAAPTKQAERAAKRVLRYLAGTRDKKMLLAPQMSASGVLSVDVYTDSDWGGGAGRRSTSGGAVMLGGAVLACWSRTQSVVAQSSGEAEYVALATAASEARWVATLLEDLGVKASEPVLWRDSSAACDMVRKNASRVKHLDLKYYFVKDLAEEGKVVNSAEL